MRRSLALLYLSVVHEAKVSSWKNDCQQCTFLNLFVLSFIYLLYVSLGFPQFHVLCCAYDLLRLSHKKTLLLHTGKYHDLA